MRIKNNTPKKWALLIVFLFFVIVSGLMYINHYHTHQVMCRDYNTDIDELKEILRGIELPSDFNSDKNSAYVEHYLRSKCFNASMALNYTFFPSHTWVIVHNIDKYDGGVIIENTYFPRIMNNNEYNISNTRSYIPDIEFNAEAVSSRTNKVKDIYVYNLDGYKNTYIFKASTNTEVTLSNILSGNYSVLVVDENVLKTYNLVVSNNHSIIKDDNRFNWLDINHNESHNEKYNKQIKDINRKIIEYLNTTNNRIPEEYYFSNYDEQNNDEKILNAILWSLPKIHEYIVNVFDCSECSSFTEWYLENMGFNTSIYINNTFNHAWIVVHTKEENIIECGIPYVIRNDSGYYIPDEKYDSIYDITNRLSIYDWNWWNSNAN